MKKKVDDMTDAKVWLENHWPQNKVTMSKTDVLILIMDFVAYLKLYKGR